MCGIAGILGLPQHTAEIAAPRMAAAISHRGPDDRGEAVLRSASSPDPVILLHQRLAIIDLSSGGHQPMQDVPADRAPSNWIIFNGEIFNYRELQDELAQAGWPCRTQSDTEVILHAYRAWGESCVERFRGMFAWCLIDAAAGRAWFCRDRLGIKPLYFYRPSAGGLLFASEMRALLAAGYELVPPKLSPTALESFLAQGAVMGGDSIVAGVSLLGPGESMITDLSGREIHRRCYWRIPPVSQHAPPRDHAVAQLGTRIREAVRLRLISEVPLGLFLSGGVDSASLATLATEVSGTRLTTVNIGFDQSTFDESEQAAAIAQELGTNHLSLRLTGQGVLEDLPQALAAMDQPTVDGFNVYFVSRAARQAGLTVALSGLGGDELFGGYASFRDAPRALRWRRTFGRVPGARAVAGILAAANRRGTVKAAQVLVRQDSLLQMYLLRRELFLAPSRRQLMPLPHGSDPFSGLPQCTLAELAEQSAAPDSANTISRLELTCYMRHMLLRDADVFSMAHALEVRVPLLDHRVVELVAGVTGQWKRPDHRPKPLLLDAVGHRLPRVSYASPKRGFTFPWAAWLRGPLSTTAARVASNHSVWTEIGMHPQVVSELWQRFSGGDQRVSALQILALVVLEDFATRHGLRRHA